MYVQGIWRTPPRRKAWGLHSRIGSSSPMGAIGIAEEPRTCLNYTYYIPDVSIHLVSQGYAKLFEKM